MHKRLTFLSSIHAPRMANSSLSSYIIKSPPIAEKARSSRDRILCVASFTEANQPPTQFVVCTSACPKLALSPAPPISTHRRTYVPQKSRKARSPKSACPARTPPSLSAASCDGWKGSGHVPRVGASRNWYRMRWRWVESVRGPP